MAFFIILLHTTFKMESGIPSVTVCSMDAASEPTGMYSRRVTEGIPESICGTYSQCKEIKPNPSL